ncbi:MAG TPA: hypothetical protein VGS41_01315, partial [Chthonomonadales bacterium]|nr:hypothetical protein [Chthonomonadales bacterium]
GALLWSQDAAHTSAGITVTDPGRAYLIQPGESAKVAVWCRRALQIAKYTLMIDFNGGTVSIPIYVKP